MNSYRLGIQICADIQHFQHGFNMPIVEDEESEITL